MARLLEPLERFLQIESASGVLLLGAALIALLWANSPWAPAYFSVLQLQVPAAIGPFSYGADLRFWVNEGLMAIFFFVVGLEIRRELHDGALADAARAALPAFAAAGGVVGPALIFLALNDDPAVRVGWAVPTATDIAFAAGVLALLGSRVPAAMRATVLALAIIDDIVAILVIAFFYSTGVQPGGLLIAAAAIAVVVVLRRLGIRQPWVYVVPGGALWLGLLIAGVHPVIAGVVLGLMTPAHVRSAAGELSLPAARIERVLHPWSAFLIMPLFAFFNAGVALDSVDIGTAGAAGLAGGVFFGLVVGKPLGVFVASYAAVRLRLCRLPDGIRWREIGLIGCFAGIGFTMSLFIAALAWPSGPLLDVAKMAVLVASTVAAVIGLLGGVLWLPPVQHRESPGSRPAADMQS